jgi:hypothetical protein
VEGVPSGRRDIDGQASAKHERLWMIDYDAIVTCKLDAK